MHVAGDIVAGKYRLDRRLASGGMGVVFEATHLDLEQRVAVKVIRAGDLDATTLARFEREARAAVKLRSEHVARVIDAGTDQDKDGDPYIVMEYLEGVPLSTHARTRGPLPPNEVALVVVHAARGLAEAHAQGIIHRDIKPANLFRCEDAAGLPIVKVLDFGISKLADLAAQGLTASGARGGGILGTPRYMSPEQLERPKAVDVRTDIWSLGVTAYELFAGRAPFTADELTVLFTQVLHDTPPSLASHRADAPPALCAAIERCLEKDPAKRFADVGELATVIANAVGDRDLVRIAEHARLVLERSRDPSRKTPAPASAAAISETDPTASMISGTADTLTATSSTAEATTLARLTPPPSKAKASSSSVPFAIAGAIVLGIAAFYGVRALLPAKTVPTEAATSTPIEPTPTPTPTPIVTTATATVTAIATTSSPVASSVQPARKTKPKPAPRTSGTPVPSALRGLPDTMD